MFSLNFKSCVLLYQICNYNGNRGSRVKILLFVVVTILFCNKFCLDGALSEFELQSLGRLLCGLTEHAWHRIASGSFLAALPQILPINCDMLSDEVMVLLLYWIHYILASYLWSLIE